MADLQTLSDLVFWVRDDQKGRPRVSWQKGKERHFLSTEQWIEAIHHTALALEEKGVGPGDRVAIFSENCPEWHIADRRKRRPRC